MKADRATPRPPGTRVRSSAVKWLNSARLGQGPDAGVSVDQSSTIEVTFESIRQWVRKWMDRPDARVALLDSTTAACDAALLAVAADVETYLHTSYAHPSIRQSVYDAASLAARLRGRPTAVGEVRLDGLALNSAAVLAEAIAGRIAERAEEQPAVVVLEHVTYDKGLRVPIAEVVERLAERNSSIKVIVDGAQAVGIWRPPASGFSAYLGCFHKYVSAPPATAFLMVEPPLCERLQSHVKSVCDIRHALRTGMLQTLDLEKWKRTARILRAHNSISTLEKRQNCAARFNEALDEALHPLVISLGSDYAAELRSHISSVAFDSAAGALHAVRAVARNGFAVQQFGRLVRITAGRDTRPEWGTTVGEIIRTSVFAVGAGSDPRGGRAGSWDRATRRRVSTL